MIMSTKRNILLAIFIVTVISTSLIFASDISSIIGDLGDGNNEKAKDASDKLARIGKPAVGHLIAALSSNDTQRKRYGARALRGIGQDAADAIPALSKLLEDRDTRTREYAVEALGNMVLQAPQVLPMLEKAKKDRSKDVADKARLAIEKIKTDVKKADGSSSESASKEAREAKSNESIKTISQENVSPTTVKSSSETKESNEIIKKLKSYQAGALAYGAFNSFGNTMWELITEAYLLKDKEGKEFEPRVNISESNLSLLLMTHSAAGTLVFDFSIEGNYAILIGGNALGETLDSMNAAMLLTVLRASMYETNPTEEAIAKATKRARCMFGEKEGVKIAVASDKQKLKKLEGFRDIKWGTVIADMNDPNFVELWVRTGDTDIDVYGRKDDKLTLGSAHLEYLQYRCYKGKFYSIEIQTPTPEDTKHLLAAVSAYYGEPEGELSEVPGSEHLDGRYWRLPIPGSKSPNEYLIMRLWIDEGIQMDLLGNIVPKTIGRFQIKYAPSLIQQVIDDEKEAADAKDDF